MTSEKNKILVHVAGARLKAGKQQYSSRRTRSKVDEVRDVLANVVVCHIPVHQFDYQQKVGSLFASKQSFILPKKLDTHCTHPRKDAAQYFCTWRLVAFCMFDTRTE